MFFDINIFWIIIDNVGTVTRFVLFILPRLAAVRFCCSCGISGVTLEQSHTTGKWVNVQFH